MKKVLVTGVTGQTGSYFVEMLLEKDYHVDGLIRRLSTPNMKNINNILNHPKFNIVAGDIEDATRISGLIKNGQYDTVYNFCGMSFVAYSFENPVQTAMTNYIGVINLIEAIRQHSPHTKMYQSSTSEMFGGISSEPNSETTPFVPRSPYAISKLASFWTIVNARIGRGIFACNGLLHNHTSPRRGIEFVTQKVITTAASYRKWKYNLSPMPLPVLKIGNMEAMRDFGHAKDYANGAYLIMQHHEPDDYVLATGEAHSVRELIEIAYEMADTSIRWEGIGKDERGYDGDNNLIVEVAPEFYRPTEVDTLIGDPSKAEKILGWKRSYSFQDLIKEMFDAATDNQR